MGQPIQSSSRHPAVNARMTLSRRVLLRPPDLRGCQTWPPEGYHHGNDHSVSDTGMSAALEGPRTFHHGDHACDLKCVSGLWGICLSGTGMELCPGHLVEKTTFSV